MRAVRLLQHDVQNLQHLQSHAHLIVGHVASLHRVAVQVEQKGRQKPDLWLRVPDLPVLRLFTGADGAAGIRRSDIFNVLFDQGSALPSAEVWLVRCSWLLRVEGARGRYTLASDAG